MSPEEIARRRLATQGLSDPRFESPAEVVRWLGAVQSQEYRPAKWSLAQRTARPSEAAVDEAVRSGSVLRTHVLRPTWHFVAAEDIRWMQAATAPRVHQANSRMYRSLELDGRLLARAHDLIARALEGHHHLTRREIGDVLERGGIHAGGQRLGYIVMHAELDALIASGEPKGKQQTYALVEERAPGAITLEPEEALAELARRYFTAHGPATAKDFTWWCSVTLAQAKQAIESAAPGLQHVEVDGETYWFGDEPRDVSEPPGTAHLLQAYDEYIGYGPSRHVYDLAGLDQRSPVPEAFAHVVVIDGQVAARWRYQPGSGGARIEWRPLRALTPGEERGWARAVARYARFTGADVEAVRAEPR